MTNAEVESIACLYADLSEYDRKALTFAPHFKKGKRRFQQLKTDLDTYVWSQWPGITLNQCEILNYV